MHGTLVDDAGAPLQGFVVLCPHPPYNTAAFPCSGGAVVSAAADGTYVAHLQPGSYIVGGGLPGGSSTPTGTFTVAAGDDLPCDLRTGSSGYVSCDQTPPAESPGHLRGTVLGTNGSPMTGLVGVFACPSATYAVPSYGCTGGGLALADSSCAFSLDLPPGSYTVIGGTTALPSPVATVTLGAGSTVTCDIRGGAPGSISCT